jgi:hypothetical protein
MRRGLQDFEYLRLIEAGGKKSRQELAALADDLVKTRDYARVRQAIFNLLK